MLYVLPFTAKFPVTEKLWFTLVPGANVPVTVSLMIVPLSMLNATGIFVSGAEPKFSISATMIPEGVQPETGETNAETFPSCGIGSKISTSSIAMSPV